MSKLEFVNLGPGEVLHTTDKAALFLLEFDEEEHWSPFSALSPFSSVLASMAAERGRRIFIGRLRVEQWFAKKIGLEPIEE